MTLTLQSILGRDTLCVSRIGISQSEFVGVIAVVVCRLPTFLMQDLGKVVVASSVAGETFTHYVIGRRGAVASLIALNPPPSVLASIKRPAPGDVRALLSGAQRIRLSCDRNVIILTQDMIRRSAVVIPGVHFDVRWSGSVKTGCILVARKTIPAHSLITEYAGEQCTIFDFASGRRRTHVKRLGTSSPLCIDGLSISKAAKREIFDSGGFNLPANSKLFAQGVAALANAPNTPSGRGSAKAGRPNCIFVYSSAQAGGAGRGNEAELLPAAGGAGAEVMPAPLVRCWLMSKEVIPANAELLVAYAWQHHAAAAAEERRRGAAPPPACCW